MNADKSPVITDVGDRLIQLCNSDAFAERILQEGKTIKGAMATMRKIAEGRKDGNSAVISSDEGYSIIMDYYGIKSGKPEARPESRPDGKIIDIMDFM